MVGLAIIIGVSIIVFYILIVNYIRSKIFIRGLAIFLHLICVGILLLMCNSLKNNEDSIILFFFMVLDVFGYLIMGCLTNIKEQESTYETCHYARLTLRYGQA